MTTEAQTLEFAYLCYCHHGDNDSYHVTERHRIVKKTRTRIVVEVERYDHRRPPGGWMPGDQRTFFLDRETFEKTGRASRSVRGAGCWQEYYADPNLYHAEVGRMNAPRCLEALGLLAGADVNQVKTAYRRLSRAVHPDAGGDDADFVQLTKDYEAALVFASRNINKENDNALED